VGWLGVVVGISGSTLVIIWGVVTSENALLALAPRQRSDKRYRSFLLLCGPGIQGKH